MSKDVTVEFRGLTFTGDGQSQLHVEKLSGWLGFPDSARFEDAPGFGHGSVPSPGVLPPRNPSAEGWLLADPDTIDGLIASIRAVMVAASPYDASTEPLVITMAGVAGRARAQLASFQIATEAAGWGSGVVPWRASWRCPDPRILGDVITATANLVVDPPGTRMSFRVGTRLAPKPIGGVVTIFNPGTDRSGSFVTVTLTGAQTGEVGVRSVTTGAKVTYDFPLAASDVLEIGSETGGEFNGEYRRAVSYSSPTWRLRAQPGINVYEALAQPGAGSPSITVSVEPAS